MYSTATIACGIGRAAAELAKGDPWSAFYSYDMAHYLELPFDFISSPNLDELRHEQAQITPSPQSQLPYCFRKVIAHGRSIRSVLDPSLHEPDLALMYQSTGVTDPAALRTEATAVMGTFLKAQPGIKANFHGLWAYAAKDGKRTPVMELPMKEIP